MPPLHLILQNSAAGTSPAAPGQGDGASVAGGAGEQEARQGGREDQAGEEPPGRTAPALRRNHLQKIKGCIFCSAFAITLRQISTKIQISAHVEHVLRNVSKHVYAISLSLKSPNLLRILKNVINI